MGDDQTKNLILAAVLSMLVVFGWYTLFPPAPPHEETAVQTADGAVQLPAGSETVAEAPAATVSRSAAMEGERIEISSDHVTGSIRLIGGRIDDLHLVEYKVEQKPDSETVVLLNPEGTAEQYYVDFGWQRTADGEKLPLPKSDTPWVLEQGERLTPTTPVRRPPRATTRGRGPGIARNIRSAP